MPRADLVEVSLVHLPANPQAVASIRAADAEEEFEIRYSPSRIVVAEVPAPKRPARPKRVRGIPEMKARALLAEMGEPREKRPTWNRANITVAKARALAKRPPRP